MPLGVIHCRDSGGRTPYIYGGADLAGCAGEKSNLHTNDLDPRRTRQGQVLLFSGLAAAGLRSKADDIGERIAVGILQARVRVQSSGVTQCARTAQANPA